MRVCAALALSFCSASHSSLANPLLLLLLVSSLPQPQPAAASTNPTISQARSLVLKELKEGDLKEKIYRW